MSSNRELGTLVGAVAGYFTGGASYVALGAAAGGIVGGLMDPKVKNEGPRLDDLKVEVSTYGIGIPRVYGIERVSPNVIWSTDKIELATTTEAGKGGGAENTTYRYYVHMRLLLCETPRSGADVQLAMIFQDGKLIYDSRLGTPLGSAFASAENPYSFFTLYQGHADQLPDPVEEIYSAPATVPAYRGVCSISMKAIECPSGRVPQFSFVIMVDGITQLDYQEGAVGDLGAAALFPTISYVPLNGNPANIFIDNYVDQGGAVYQKVLSYTPAGIDYLGVRTSIPLPDQAYNYYNIPGHADIDAVCFREVPATTSLDTGNNMVVTAQGDIKRFLTGPGLLAYGQSASCRWAKNGARFAISSDENQQPVTVFALYDWDTTEELGRASVQVTDLYLTESYLWIFYVDATLGASLQVRLTSDFTLLSDTVMPPELDFEDVLNIMWSAQVGDTLSAFVFYGAAQLWSISVTPIGVVTFTPTYAESALEIPAGLIPSNVGYNVAIRGSNVIGAYVSIGGSNSAQPFLINFAAVEPAAVTVGSIIAAECEIAGETRYDVTGIPGTDTVQGYKIGSPASARANIDPLLTAFQIFIVDEDGQIKFKKYSDITSVATIAFDELGQAEDGSDPSDPMPLTRSQEIDLPKSVSVSYIEPLNDYQVATEKEIRQITEATEDMLVQLPLAITSDQARTAAQQILYSSWRRQNTRSLKVSRKYAFLSPGDGTLVEYPLNTFRLWRWTQINDTGALIEGNLEPGDAVLYTQVAIGATEYVGQQVAALPPPTQLTILDTPILRDADNNAGVYTALAGVGPNWPGGELLVGPDAGSLQSRGTVQNQSPFGSATNVLGDWTTNIVDESNTLTVDVGTATLNSITRSVLLTGSENVAAVGVNGRWEILKFQRATSLGDGLYMLSGLMRGLRGTEWATGLHQLGDTFAVMSIAGMLRLNLSAGEIGQDQIFTAVTAGRPIASGTTRTYANTGEGLEPFSPTNLVKDFDGDDITLAWVRRTRLSENWLMGIVPLGEASERWQVLIYADDTFATVVRTINTTTASAVYTSAMQIADFGSNQTEISVRVAQISDVVGAGHELEETI